MLTGTYDFADRLLDFADLLLDFADRLLDFAFWQAVFASIKPVKYRQAGVVSLLHGKKF